MVMRVILSSSVMVCVMILGHHVRYILVSERLVLVMVVPSPKSRLISLIFLGVILDSVVVNCSGVLLAIASVFGVSIAHAVRCVAVCTATMICAADINVLLRYALAVTE